MRRAFLEALILVSVCLAGCRCINFETQIITEPPGAKIEVNNDYVGTSPCIATICGYRGRLFIGPSTINALPLEPGQWVQRKFFYDRSPIPKVVYFDMKLTPANADINVNLNQRTVRQSGPQVPAQSRFLSLINSTGASSLLGLQPLFDPFDPPCEFAKLAEFDVLVEDVSGGQTFQTTVSGVQKAHQRLYAFTTL